MKNQKPKDGNQKPENDLLPLKSTDEYELFLSTLKTRIRRAQVQATLSVNAELTLLYWQIGQDILQRQAQEGWGSKVIARLAKT